MNAITNLWRKIYGEPVWTMDFQGEVRKARLKRYGDLLMVTKVHGWCLAYNDGTVHRDSYLRRWWLRQ